MTRNAFPVRQIGLMSLVVLALSAQSAPAADEEKLPPNRWVALRRDHAGARPGSATRYAPEAGVFLLWGFMNADPDLLEEHPLMEVPEYDVVSFDPADRRWRNHFPKQWEEAWSKKLPLAYIPATYAGKTSGSERIVLHGPTEEEEGAPRPDLNIVYDQVAYHSPSKSLFYFTGGLTAAYDVLARRWSDLMPAHSPPPVMAGSLAYDPLHDEMVLFGGGYVAERNANGKVIGYTGTWAYDFRKKDWLPVQTEWQPPPRMNTRLVCDTRNQVLVLFGGDAQSEYLADTWLYDLQARKWRQSKAAVGPEARAGHFTAYDPQTGWVIIGGGYNREDLTDMWAYDTAKDHWVRLAGQVPAGFYVTGDIAPEKRLILLVTSNRTTDDKMTCNILYPVRTTYAYRIDEKTVIHPDPSMRAQQAMPKRPPEDSLCGTEPDAARQKAQAERLATMPVNQWVYLAHPGRVAPDRTWGSATFDTDRGRILYWGGEHCGYEGSDVDAYDVTLHTWLGSPSPEYPDRMWDHGYSRNLSMGLTGVTFRGDPWTIHARRIYSYDLVSGKMIMVRPVRLTMGYNPESLLQFPGEARAYVDALVKPPGSYDKWVTWAFDLVTRQWHVAGPAPVGLDTLVTTRHGVIGVTVDWPARTNDAGYLLPWSPSLPPKDTAVYLFRWLSKRWTRLGKPQPSPQNLWEMTSLVYDSTRDRVILHGGGKKRNELWTFDLRTHRWEKLKSTVEGGAEPPECSREAVYLPHEDVVLIFGPAPQDRSQFQLWAYKVSESTWHQIDIPAPAAADSAWEFSQNRAMVYDPNRDLVFLVLGTGGDRGKAFVFALKYRHDQARFVATRAAR